jgi:inosine/xanthosine triphosphatase
MIIVGSSNPVKVQPVQSIFAQLLPNLEVHGVMVPSKVREQPLGFEETYRGALSRALGALEQPSATWGIGLEGGVEFDRHGAWLFGIVVVHTQVKTTFSRSSNLLLPPAVGKRVQAGEELGPVMDQLFGTQDIKTKGGAVSLLTGGLLERAEVWKHTVILALAPHLNLEQYSS